MLAGASGARLYAYRNLDRIGDHRDFGGAFVSGICTRARKRARDFVRLEFKRNRPCTDAI